MPRPSSLPAGNSSHTYWGDLLHAWTFHSTGNTGSADADDIKGSNDATLVSSAVLSDTLGLDVASADEVNFTNVTLTNAFSVVFRAKLDAVGNNSMVFGNGSTNTDYLWLDSGTDRSEYKKGGGVTLSGTTDSEKTTLYDYCLTVEAESGSLHQIKLYRKTTAGTTWTEISSGSTNNLGSAVINTVGGGFSGGLGMAGEVEYFFIFDGVGFTTTELDADFADPYDVVEAPDSITLTAQGVHSRVRYKKSSGTYAWTLAGNYNGTPTSIEWRHGGSGSWTVGDASPSGGTFSFSASIDGTTYGQGFEVRFSNDTGVTDSDPLVGVYDVYLAEADSLANGSADNAQTHTPRTYTCVHWRSSTGWINPTAEQNHWPRLFDQLSDDRPIAILNAASGGAELTGIRASTNASNISAAQCVGVNGLVVHGGANEAIPTLNSSTDTAAAWSTELQAIADDYATTYPGCKSYFSISGPVGSGTEANVHNIREGVLLAAAANSNVELGSNVWWRALGDNLHPKSDADCDAYGEAWWFALRSSPTSQPEIVQATHNSGKTEVTVQFDASLRTGTTLTAALFEVTDDGTPVTISTAVVSGVNVVLTLASAATGTLTVSCGKGVNNTGTPPQGAAVNLPNSGGDYYPAVLPFYNQSVAAADDVPPTFASAQIPTGGTTVVVTLTETGTPPVLPLSAITGFTLSSDGDALSILSTERTGNTEITLTANRPILSTETVTVAYSGGNVTDSAPSPNSMANFTAQAVTNNSTQSSGGGNAVFPAENQTLLGNTYGPNGNDFNGNVVVPSASDVLTRAPGFGPNGGTTGLYVPALENKVELDYQFGANGTEFTGTLVSGGTGPGGTFGATDLSLIPRASRTVAPTLDLVTIAQAKSHLSISSSDTTHDDRLGLLIDAARDQLEEDTGLYIAEQTWQLKLPYFYSLQFVQTPVMSIESISYYNSTNASTAFTDFSLDSSRNYLVLNSTPATYDRYDAVTITYKVGETNDAAQVRAIAKQAVLLLVGHYFENPDMLVGLNVSSMHAYEQLVKKLQRSTYP